ncbi:MAG: 2-C-methyl-D-erythritol 2,4-cyclodiphosphate synthase [Gammaproteobacteria bacterium]|nr:2-C-methyl-D-erythritol 2,4-cyclodiphosphate synthase [Gammaproteobacteria bacterium]
MQFRIGNGFDAHRFKANVPLVLGGVRIEYDKGLEAHSDGDVVLHALCDAVLGALAMGDIGQHFPDNDQQYRGIDSRILLRRIFDLMQAAGYRVGNADVTIIAQAPRLAPHIPDMRQRIAEDLRADVNMISVKATTTERLGFTGREEGIAAQASVLLERVPSADRVPLEL